MDRRARSPRATPTFPEPPVAGYSLDLFEHYLEVMQQQFELLHRASDRRAVFHLTYLTFGRHVLAALKEGRFHDSEWEIDMACRFLETYFEQFSRWERRDETLCAAWRIAFDECVAGRVNVVQAMLLGMNAHVSYDLAFVTLGACRDAGDLAGATLDAQALGESRGAVPVVRYRDFLVINQIAWECLPALQDVVLRTFNRWLYWGNRLARRHTRPMGERLLLEARDVAWCHTCLLIHSDREHEQVEALINSYAATFADAILAMTLHPRRFLANTWLYQRRSRRLESEVQAGLVSVAGSNPVVAELALHQLAFAGADPVAVLAALGANTRMASVFVMQVFRIGPKQQRRALRRHLRRGTAKTAAVCAALVDAGATNRDLPAGTPARRLHRRWCRELDELRGHLLAAERARHSQLADALRHRTAVVEQRLGRLDGNVPSPGRSMRSDPRLLLQHRDQWVAVCAQNVLDHPDHARSDSMTKLIERVLFLKDTPIFMEVDPAVLMELAEHLEPRQHEPGALLLRAGETPGGIYLLREGEVVVTQQRAGQDVPINTVGPYGSLGELSALNGRTATADCRARTEVASFFVPTAVLARLLHQHPRLAIGVLRVVSERLIAATEPREDAETGAPRS